MSAAIQTAELPPAWQATLDYVRAFVAERLKYAVHTDGDGTRKLRSGEGETVLRAVFDLLAEQEFLDLVKGLPGG